MYCCTGIQKEKKQTLILNLIGVLRSIQKYIAKPRATSIIMLETTNLPLERKSKLAAFMATTLVRGSYDITLR